MTVNQRERQKREKKILLLFLAEEKKNSTGIPHTENTKILNISVLLQLPVASQSIFSPFSHMFWCCSLYFIYLLPSGC